MDRLVAVIVSVFQDIPSLKGYLNPGELLKALVSGLGAGTLVGVLQAVLASVGTIFAGPYIPLATAVLTILIMVVRSLGHGAEPPKSGPVR